MATSSSGKTWAYLFDLYMAIALIVGALVLGWLFYSMLRFRERPDDERPRDAPVAGVLSAERGHPATSYVMGAVVAVVMLGLAFSTISAVENVERPPADALVYDVTGFQFGWKVNYTGEGGVPFQKIGEWTVPVDTPIVYRITSQDVWHNFALTEYRMRIDAIPGTVNTIWFEAYETGVQRPVCVQICGSGHAQMKSTMYVVSAEEYQAFLKTESEKAYANFAKRGNVVNVTLNGTAILPANEIVPANKPVVFNATNTHTVAKTFSVQDASGKTLASVQVPQGGFGRLYVANPAQGPLTLVDGGLRATLQVVK